LRVEQKKQFLGWNCTTSLIIGISGIKKALIDKEEPLAVKPFDLYNYDNFHLYRVIINNFLFDTTGGE